jgi:hypothetical protein
MSCVRPRMSKSCHWLARLDETTSKNRAWSYLTILVTVCTVSVYRIVGLFQKLHYSTDLSRLSVLGTSDRADDPFEDDVNEDSSPVSSSSSSSSTLLATC